MREGSGECHRRSVSATERWTKRLCDEALEGASPRKAVARAIKHAGPTAASAGVILAGTFAHGRRAPRASGGRATRARANRSDTGATAARPRARPGEVQQEVRVAGGAVGRTKATSTKGATQMTTLTSTSLPHGRELLRNPRLNRGTAFTHEEREALGLEGLLPAAVQTLDEQSKRAFAQYQAQASNLAKNGFLAALHDRNEVLYYKLLEEHLKEMLPVVYAPVIAQAIQRYSHEFQRPNGVYLSIDDIDGVETAFRNFGLGADDVDLLVATGAEAIRGIGDWGSNGMAISIGKLAIYTAAAGIHPRRAIPLLLD